MTPRARRISDLLAARVRIDAELARLGHTDPLPAVTALIHLPRRRRDAHTPHDTLTIARFLLRKVSTMYPEDDDMRADRLAAANTESDQWNARRKAAA